ncbi:MAG: YifB family Mg chelatase-like AAA ATPase [Firmicutes bacterium]|nr:YifB family Mg chelatase-like AAA ATPase [Bacillota bacterium]
MVSKINSCGLSGIDGFMVETEVDMSAGLPGFEIVGLPDSAVKESKERVKTAINNSGFQFPISKLTVNLAPADTRKEGPAYDLPIAMGILSQMGIVKSENLVKCIFIGELSLDGGLRSVNGVLPMVMEAKEKGFEKCFLPVANATEAALVEGLEVYGARSVSEIVEFLRGNAVIEPTKVDIKALFEQGKNFNTDFSDVKGQDAVKRALEIAAAGMHNVLMVGPPGSGKTMCSKRFPTILPDLTFKESMEITKIYSVAGLLKNKEALITQRTFRSPHHTISGSAMVGGGRVPRPGEVSLACHGVLFLDELPEFQRNVLEELRQPLEDRVVTISRVNATMTYPADFTLIASMNPCPCGYYGYSDKCTCTPNQISRYMAKISGPLLDRIDIQVEASAVDYKDLNTRAQGEKSEDIRKRVIKAHKIQLERYKNEKIFFNSQLSAAQIEKYCSVDEQGASLIKLAFDKFEFSARSYHKILKIARTIADLEGEKDILPKHISEALQLRNLDRASIHG